MIRSALKSMIVLIVLVGLGAFLLGRRSSGWEILPESSVDPSGLDTSKVREVGAKVGEVTANAAQQAANAAQQAKDTLETGGITAKIKSKMALDELVKARNIDVDTNGSVVTLTGVVGSKAERQRAVQLAKETQGVTAVIDRLRLP